MSVFEVEQPILDRPNSPALLPIVRSGRDL
jgi:hypothetical protein